MVNYDDLLAVVADLRIEHDAANTVRSLRWESDTLHFVLDVNHEEPGRPCSVELGDWAVLTRDSGQTSTRRLR